MMRKKPQKVKYITNPIPHCFKAITNSRLRAEKNTTTTQPPAQGCGGEQGRGVTFSAALKKICLLKATLTFLSKAYRK
jgi:hypothetical protein